MITNDPPFTFTSAWLFFVLSIVFYFFCYCCCFSCPGCRCARRERGHMSKKTRLFLFALYGGLFFGVWLTIIITLANVDRMVRAYSLLGCGVTSLISEMLAGESTKSRNSFPGMIGLQNTLDDLRIALLPNSKFLQDLDATISDVSGVSKATEFIGFALELIEDSYKHMGDILENELKRDDKNAVITDNNVKTLIHDQYFSVDSKFVVPAKEQSDILKKIIGSSNKLFEANDGNVYPISIMHKSIVSKPISEAAFQMRDAIVNSAGAKLQLTVVEIKKQFFSNLDGQLGSTREMLESGGNRLARDVFDEMIITTFSDWMDPTNDIFAVEGGDSGLSGAIFYIYLASFFPFGLMVPAVLLSLLAFITFMHSQQGAKQVEKREEADITNSGRLLGYVVKKMHVTDSNGKVELKHVESPGAFACCGYCYGCIAMLILLLSVAFMSTVSFIGASACHYLDVEGSEAGEPFNSAKLNTTLYKLTGEYIDSNPSMKSGGQMVDTCLTKKGNGMLLQVVEQKACKKNETTDSYPETCTEEQREMQTVDAYMRNAVLGEIRKQFDIAGQEVAQIQDEKNFRNLLDLLNVDRLGSVVGSGDFFANKLTGATFRDPDFDSGDSSKTENDESSQKFMNYTSTFAMGLEVGLACFRTKLPGVIVEQLPNATMRSERTVWGIEDYIQQAFVDREYFKHADNLSRNVENNPNFLDEELFPGLGDKATCGISIPSTCDSAKMHKIADAAPEDVGDVPTESENKLFSELQGCKTLMEEQDDQTFETAGGNAWARLTDYFTRTEGGAQWKDYYEATTDQGLDHDLKIFQGEIYECRPCFAGLNVLRLKFGLRAFLPAKKYAIEFPKTSTFEGDKYKEAEFSNPKAVAFDEYELKNNADSNKNTIFYSTEVFGCDAANVLNNNPGFSCLNTDRSYENSKEVLTFSMASQKFTREQHAEISGNVASNPNPFTGSNAGFSWASVYGGVNDCCQAASNGDIDFNPRLSTALETASDRYDENSNKDMDNLYLKNETATSDPNAPKMNSYWGALLKRAVFRYDNETLNTFPKIIGEAPKVVIVESLVNSTSNLSNATSIQTASALEGGSGIKGIVEEYFLKKVEFDLLDRANCQFLGRAWGTMFDSICHLGIPAMYSSTLSYFYASLAQLGIIAILKWIWRYVRDNVEMKRKRRKKMLKELTKC